MLAGAAALKGVRLARRRPRRATLRALAAGAARRRRLDRLALRADARARGRAPLRPSGRRTARALAAAIWPCGRIARDDRRLRRRPASTPRAADRGGRRARRGAARRSTRAARRASCRCRGHYAAVLEVAPNLGIALGTDGVGSKLIVAEQAGRYDTVGIDCVAMNVNDVVCVGAEPIALLDYLAVEQADPDVMREIARGPQARRRGWPASRSPAARSPCCPS